MRPEATRASTARPRPTQSSRSPVVGPAVGDRVAAGDEGEEGQDDRLAEQADGEQAEGELALRAVEGQPAHAPRFQRRVSTAALDSARPAPVAAR